MEFVLKALVHPNFRELCREYGISAKTGYKWRERFIAQGLGGLHDLSRRPHGHGAELGEAVVCEMVRLKQAHPHWGPRKIQALYQRRHGGPAPSESSFKRVLERAGLTLSRRVRRTIETGRLSQGHKASAPNEVWSVDFKGWWRDREGLRVEPLTVRDEHSRMVLELRALVNCQTATVRACFERLFTQYGLPGVIRSDNGAPFASTLGLHGLTRLSAWWLVLGIDLERGRPGCPQDNGAHERMHLDIRRELEGGRIGRDQAAFDLWRKEYNTERPHEALGMRVPAEVYQPSARVYAGTPTEIDYGGMTTRKVQEATGQIGYCQEKIMITTAIGGWTVGLSPQANGLVEVWFSRMLLGRLKAGQSEQEKCNP